jgi:signal transduction histidine kinase
LHATAQPLSILRASLSNNQMDQMGIEELRELADSSGTEVERLCSLFNCLQQLVRTESTRPSLSKMAVQPLIENAIDGVDLLFKDDGIFLHSIVSGDCQPVFIDSSRTLQALSTVLLIAHAVSRREDTVEVIVSPSLSNAVRVVVRNLTSHVDAMKPEASLNMAFAETNIRSQHAGFSWSLQPFSVQIDLQRAPPAHYC